MSPEDSKKLLKRLLDVSAPGDLYRSNENTVYYVSPKDVTETFECDLNNGNFTYNKSLKKYAGDYAPKLPTQEEALKEAEQFLNTQELLPKNRNELTLAHFGGLRSTSVIGGKRAGPVIDKLVTLSYGRTIDNTPVIGPGSKIVVNLGDKGEVMGLIRRWREVSASSRKLVPPEELVSQQEAEERANRQIVSEYGDASSHKILGSRRAYYDNNGSILQPVYAFEVAVTLRDPKVRPFNYLCVIPMMKNSPEPLNLTGIDPRAKEMIKNGKPGEKPYQTPEKRQVD
jgi:hypothetical protein